ncbi:hypothetical protein DL765_010876 [Monosporascus sp. GIB2]|nr:hypothetical protein DL765_010876 [Monosporascus sp. GIB2]
MFAPSAPATAPAADIATEAAATTALLDRAASQINTGCQAPSASAALSKHNADLTTVRNLVQKVRFQGDLQTPPVGIALTELKVVADRLAQVLSAGPASLATQEFTNAMDEVVQAAKNLQQRLPGDISTAVSNEAQGGFQNNAAVGGARGDGRLTTEATRNKSTDATQINAPIYGDPAALAQFVAAARQARV